MTFLLNIDRIFELFERLFLERIISLFGTPLELLESSPQLWSFNRPTKIEKKIIKQNY